VPILIKILREKGKGAYFNLDMIDEKLLIEIRKMADSSY